MWLNRVVIFKTVVTGLASTACHLLMLPEVMSFTLLWTFIFGGAEKSQIFTFLTGLFTGKF